VDDIIKARNYLLSNLDRQATVIEESVAVQRGEPVPEIDFAMTKKTLDYIRDETSD
jgi:hypothetical protein